MYSNSSQIFGSSGLRFDPVFLRSQAKNPSSYKGMNYYDYPRKRYPVFSNGVFVSFNEMSPRDVLVQLSLQSILVLDKDCTILTMEYLNSCLVLEGLYDINLDCVFSLLDTYGYPVDCKDHGISLSSDITLHDLVMNNLGCYQCSVMVTSYGGLFIIKDAGMTGIDIGRDHFLFRCFEQFKYNRQLQILNSLPSVVDELQSFFSLHGVDVSTDSCLEIPREIYSVEEMYENSPDLRFYEGIGDSVLSLYSRVAIAPQFDSISDASDYCSKLNSNKNQAMLFIKTGLSKFFQFKCSGKLATEQMANMFELIMGIVYEDIGYDNTNMFSFLSRIGYTLVYDIGDKSGIKHPIITILDNCRSKDYSFYYSDQSFWFKDKAGPIVGFPFMSWFDNTEFCFRENCNLSVYDSRALRENEFIDYDVIYSKGHDHAAFSDVNDIVCEHFFSRAFSFGRTPHSYTEGTRDCNDEIENGDDQVEVKPPDPIKTKKELRYSDIDIMSSAVSQFSYWIQLGMVDSVDYYFTQEGQRWCVNASILKDGIEVCSCTVKDATSKQNAKHAACSFMLTRFDMSGNLRRM